MPRTRHVELPPCASGYIHTVLAENGINLRYAPHHARGLAARHITHMLDMRCRENGIERLALGHRVKSHECFKQARHLRQRHHIGAIRRRVIGILMGLDEQGRDTDCNRST